VKRRADGAPKVALSRRIARLAPKRVFVRVFRRQTVHLAQRHLAGLRGIEIGAAAHNDFGVDAINVDRTDSMDTVYKRYERDICGLAKPVDLVAQGDHLPFGDQSVDFVLASHVLEHMPDPIAALEEWIRVSRECVFLVVPHRDRTFDRDRPLTTLAELVERHEAAFHPDEDRHWSVWTCESLLEVCDHLGFDVVDTRDPDHWRGNGFVVVISASGRRSSEPGKMSKLGAKGEKAAGW
jgi:SAM-dependent methyltransferase